MTNRVRTLLLNLRPWTGSDRPAGEQYVPDAYIVRRLTPVLAAARALLFGSGADRTGMNLTLARLLGYLHASPFHADVTAADARITYDPTRPADVFGSLGPAVAEGDPVAGWSGVAGFAAAGRAYGKWTVVTDGAGNYTVTPTGSGVTSTGSVTVTDVGDAVPLPGSTLSVVVPTGDAGTRAVTLLVPPTHSFATLSTLSDATALFRPSGGAREAAWYAAWSGGGPPWYRAAAAALALAERTDELSVQ